MPMFANSDSRSQGHGMPRLPDRAMTPSRMPTLGRTEKVALAVMARFMRATFMPMAFPAFQARRMNTRQTTATKATIAPQIRYMVPLFSWLSTDICIPSFTR